MNLKKILSIIMSILIIVSGVYCLFNPTMTYMSVGYLVGVVILCDAIANIMVWVNAKKYVEVSAWFLVSAIISLLFGLAIIISLRMQFAVDLAIIYMISIWIIVMGCMRISIAIRMKKFMNKIPIFKNNRWLYILLLGILMIIFGIICIVKPVVLSTMLGVIIGLMIIVLGSNLLMISMYTY